MNPKLDLLIIPSNSKYILSIADISVYPEDFAIVSPTIEIEVPGFFKKVFPFNPKNIEIYDSGTLNITGWDCDRSALPDGLYTISYSVQPNYINLVTKNYMRVDSLYEKFDKAYMRATEPSKDFDEIEFYIQGAISSANQCATGRAMELYNKANSLLDKYC